MAEAMELPPQGDIPYAQPAFTVVAPMAVHAIVISADFGQSIHQIAPAIQPDYSSLLQGPRAGEPTHDLMDQLDISYWGVQAQYNPRFVNLASDAPRLGRQGVYLSWCLPRMYRTGIAATESALAREVDKKHWEERRIRTGYGKPKAVENEADKVHFRPAPDRWIVIRNVHEQPEKTRRFLVESNCIRTIDDPEFGSQPGKHDIEMTTAPAMDPSKPMDEQDRLRMGRVAELTAQNVGAASTRSYREQFNAFAMGHEFFADYQPHNMGVFSVFDNLEGVDQGKVDYMVVGYHSTTPDNHIYDPLVVVDALQPDADRKKRTFNNGDLLDALKIVTDSSSPAQNTFRNAVAGPIARTLTHGVIRNVLWNRQFSKLSCPATILQEDVYEHQPIAIGTHTLDALAAYLHVALDPDDAQSATTVNKTLGQLMMLIRREDDVDSQLQAADEVSGYSWLPKSEGTVWQFPKDEEKQVTPPQPGTLTQKVSISEDQRQRLSNLNEIQMMLDTCTREQEQLVKRLYWCWWNAAGLRNAPSSILRSRREKVRTQAQEIALRMATIAKAIVSLKRSILADKTKLENEIGKGKVLVGAPANAFGHHQDPAVVVAGTRSGWPPGFNDSLPIRLASEIAPQRASDGNEKTWLDGILPKVSRPCNSLLREFDEVDAGIRRTGWKPNPYASLEDMGGSQGWFPLFLEWELEYYHIPFSRWVLKSNEKVGGWRYVVPDKMPDDATVGADMRTIHGRTVFVPEPGKTLKTRFQQLFDRFPAADVASQTQRDDVLAKVANLEYFSAPLAGFADNLLTLQRGHHSRPASQDKDIQNVMGLSQDILAVLEKASNEQAPYGATTWLPPSYTANFSPFKPVVHGQARFTKLAIVDKFGQIVSGLRPGEYGDGPGTALYPCVSPSLSCGVIAGNAAGGSEQWPNTAVQAEEQAGLCQFFQIPPRINQPARLNSHFLEPLPKGDDGSKGTRRRSASQWTNPIWAWLLPNFHGYSIQVFDPDGEFALEIALDQDTETATPSLGPNNAGLIPPATGRLGALLTAMKSYQFAAPLFDMLAGASDSSSTSAADFSQSLPAALGRPFCIADVGLSIELASPPLSDQSLLKTDNAELSSEERLLDYSFPLALGNPMAAFDGLVGTFPASGPLREVATAYTRDATLLSSSSNGVATVLKDAENHPQPLSAKPYFLPGTSTSSFSLAVDHDAKLVCVSAILDPKSPLSIYSGSLFPVAKMDLPRWPVDSAIQSLRAFFAVGPILVPEKPSPIEVGILATSTMATQASPSSDPDQPPPMQAPPQPTVQMPLAGGEGKDATWRWLQPRRDPTDPAPEPETQWSDPMPIRQLDTALKVEATVNSEILEGHAHPAFANRASDRAPNGDIPPDKQLGTSHARFWSYQEAAMPIDTYSLNITQRIEAPRQDDPSKTGEALDLPLPVQALKVSGPKFALRDPSDIHGVYPAPGQTEYAKALAHVVLSHPTIPWERDLRKGQPDGFNRMPWLAVLSFTEDELVFDKKTFETAGFTQDDEVSSDYGTVSTKAGRLQQSTSVLSGLNAVGSSTDWKPADNVSPLLLSVETFKALFSGYDAQGNPSWVDKADLSRFSLMAHLKETHGGFMASSYTGGDGGGSKVQQPQFSVVVSPRTGPPEVPAPTRVISHLISLEDLDRIDVSQASPSQFVGLVSLYAWDWMCVPENQVDFRKVMANLGRSVRPLRIDDDRPPPPQGTKPTIADNWLADKLNAGFVPKQHTLLSGTETTSLLRGPLIPVLPSRNIIKAFSLFGEGLTLTDKTTGIADVSYSSAWALGRSLIMAEPTLTASLLRLRGQIHAEAVRRAKARALVKKGHGPMNAEMYLSTLHNSVGQLKDAHNVSGLKSRRSATARWTRTENTKSKTPAMRLSDSSYSLTDYLDQISLVTDAFFGYESKDEQGNTVPPRPTDADAAAIRAWALDKFFLANLPLHHLILHPNVLPRESIRTFCIDHKWMDCVIDGGLSLANHSARDDDALRRALKDCINKYLAAKRTGGPGDGTTLQIPRWGFLLRSIAVTAFPDLKVEAELDNNTPVGVREVLYMQVLAEDILLCLFDRVPGEDGFKNICITQPSHQQGFAAGTRIDATNLHIAFRPIPLTTGPNIGGEPLGADYAKPKAINNGVKPYDWSSRLLCPNVYMRDYGSAIATGVPPDSQSKVFKWEDWNNPPASLLATQLGTPILQLVLQLKKDDTASPPASNSKRWEEPGAQLYVRPRPDSTSLSSPPASAIKPRTITTTPPRPDPAFVTLPSGPRKALPQQPDPQEHVGADVLELVESPLLPFQPRPARVRCFPSYDPGNSNETIYTVGSPINLVFVLETDAGSSGDTTFPGELEVRIPVALGSRVYPPGMPADGGSGALIELPGSAWAPSLPVIEALDPNQEWTYKPRLVQGHSYAIQPNDPSLEPGDMVPPLSTACVMLHISVKRRAVLSSEGPLSASFLLRQAKVPSPTSGETQAQIDVLWHDSNGANNAVASSVNAARVHILQAVTLKILDKSFYDWNAKRLCLRVQPSRALGVQQIELQWQAQFTGVISSRLVSFSSSAATPGILEGTVDFDEQTTPGSIRLGVVETTSLPGGGVSNKRVGPQTMPWLLPHIDRDLITDMFWDSSAKNLSMFEPSTGDMVPVTVSFTVLDTPAGNPTAVQFRSKRFPSPVMTIDQATLAPFFVDNRVIWLLEEVHFQHERLVGILRSRKRVFARPSEKVIPALPVGGLPAGLKASPDAGLCKAALLKNTNGRQMWYWAGDRTLVATQWARKVGFQAVQKVTVKDTRVPGTNAMAILPHKEETSCSIAWIGKDGSINVSSPSPTAPNEWSTTTLEPAGHASVVAGQGSLAASGEWPVTWKFKSGGIDLWWIGSQGEIFFRRWRETQWSPTFTPVNAGAIRVNGPRLPKLEVMWDSSSSWNANLIWVSMEGDIMLTSVLLQGFHAFATLAIVPDARAAPYGSIATTICGFSSVGGGLAIPYIFWLTEDGAVWGAWADDAKTASVGPQAWHRFRIAPAGAAHPWTQLCLVGGVLINDGWPDLEPGVMLVWVHPSGKLHCALWWKDSGKDYAAWSWSSLSPERQVSPEGNLSIIATQVADNGTHELFWFGEDGGLQTLGLSMPS
ncbi:Fc.00g108510.m01.CDS01 [Cosmosporella sp. VM-42]